MLGAQRYEIKIEKSDLSGEQDLQGTAIRINWFQLFFSLNPNTQNLNPQGKDLDSHSLDHMSTPWLTEKRSP